MAPPPIPIKLKILWTGINTVNIYFSHCIEWRWKYSKITFSHSINRLKLICLNMERWTVGSKEVSWYFQKTIAWLKTKKLCDLRTSISNDSSVSSESDLTDLTSNLLLDALRCLRQGRHGRHVRPAERTHHWLQDYVAKELLHMCEKHVKDSVPNLNTRETTYFYSPAQTYICDSQYLKT